jgi:hypothetical protein
MLPVPGVLRDEYVQLGTWSMPLLPGISGLLWTRLWHSAPAGPTKRPGSSTLKTKHRGLQRGSMNTGGHFACDSLLAMRYSETR